MASPITTVEQSDNALVENSNLSNYNESNLLKDVALESSAVNSEMEESIPEVALQASESSFQLSIQQDAEIEQQSSSLFDLALDRDKADEQFSEAPFFTNVLTDESIIETVANREECEFTQKNELLNLEEDKKDLITDIDEASERVLVAADDDGDNKTRHLNEDMDISQISTDAKNVMEFNFLKPSSFISLGMSSKDSCGTLSLLGHDAERDLQVKDTVHPHVPEKVLNIDEETRMSLEMTSTDSTSAEASFIYPSLPPKKLFHIDDTKDSDPSDVETKMSSMTDTEDIRLIHTISIDDATKDSGASDSNVETPLSKKPRRSSRESLGILDGLDVGRQFGAENVFEYQWPQDGGEWHMLQEHISEYLKVKSFKRKYPDLYRRTCDKEEKDFLRDKNVVTETQADLGLTALRSEEVYDLMMKDYNDKYKEYIAYLQEKQKKVIREKHKEYSAAAKLDKTKIEAYSKKAARSAAEYNASLMRDRKEERRAYFDLQTFTVHFPKHRYQTVEPKHTKVGAYPVSLVPGQYQDYYKKYAPEELKYLPVKTVLFNPPGLVPYVRPPSSGIILVHPEKQTKVKAACSEGEDDGSSSGEDIENELDESVQTDNLDLKPNGQTDMDMSFGKVDHKIKSTLKKKVSKFLLSPERLKKLGKKVKDSEVEKVDDVSQDGEDKGSNSASKMPTKIHGLEKCRICKKRSTKEERLAGKLVKCAQCGKIGHMSCLDLTEELVAVIKTYPWQCMECKTCSECFDPYDEDKMMFCDRCDRGYHTFCIGLEALPTGHWECKSCEGCPAIVIRSHKVEQVSDSEMKSDEDGKVNLSDATLNETTGSVENNSDVTVKAEQLEKCQPDWTPGIQQQEAATSAATTPKDTPPIKVERRGRKRKVVDPNTVVVRVTPGAARQSKRLKLKEEEEEEAKRNKKGEEIKTKRLKKRQKISGEKSSEMVADEVKDVVGEGVDDSVGEGVDDSVAEGVDDSMAIIFDRNEDEVVIGEITNTEQEVCDMDTHNLDEPTANLSTSQASEGDVSQVSQHLSGETEKSTTLAGSEAEAHSGEVPAEQTSANVPDEFLAQPAMSTSQPEVTSQITEPLETEPNSHDTQPTTLQNEPTTLQNEPTTLQNEPTTLQNEPTTLQNEPITQQAELSLVQDKSCPQETEPTTLRTQETELTTLDNKSYPQQAEALLEEFDLLQQPSPPQATIQQSSETESCIGQLVAEITSGQCESSQEAVSTSLVQCVEDIMK